MSSYELPPIGHALSGGVAAALANAVLYPIDMAVTIVQSQSTSASSSSSSSGSTRDQHAQENAQPLPIEFKRPSLPQSTSSSSSAVTASDVIVGEDGKKRIVKTITTTTTTTTTRSSASSSSLKKPHYKSVPDAIKRIYASEGFKALYAGLGSDTIATLTSNFVYFYIYMALRQRKEHRRKSGQLSTLQELFLGAEAGILSRFFTAPIHVVTTRQQVAGSSAAKEASSSSPSHNNKASARSIVREIYAQDGITGFWAGYAPTVILSINPSITYFLFETIKKSIVARQTKAAFVQAAVGGGAAPSKSILAAAASLTSLQIFFISACSKAIASFVTYPLILTKTKLQTKIDQDTNDNNNHAAEQENKDPSEKKTQFNGISDVIKTVLKDQGIAGLYTGCQGQVIKGFFSFGLMYMIKDRVVAYMLTLFLAIHNMRRRVQA